MQGEAPQTSGEFSQGSEKSSSYFSRKLPEIQDESSPNFRGSFTNYRGKLSKLQREVSRTSKETFSKFTKKFPELQGKISEIQGEFLNV